MPGKADCHPHRRRHASPLHERGVDEAAFQMFFHKLRKRRRLHSFEVFQAQYCLIFEGLFRNLSGKATHVS